MKVENLINNRIIHSWQVRAVNYQFCKKDNLITFGFQMGS